MKPHPVNPVHPVKTPWPTVRLSEVLTRADETIKPEADTEYREITVKLWGKGVIERGRVTGAEISGRRFVARTGQFIASRIDARNGAMGLVPASLNGALVTNDFPLFHLNAKRLEPAFLGWLCRTADFVELCLRASEGTTNRVRLKEDSFLALEIPLPPVAEQRRVVTRIEELAAQIQEARTLRRQAAEEAEALLRSIITDDKQARLTPMRELVKLRSPDVTARTDETYQFAGVYCFGRGVFKAARKSGMDFAYPRLTRLCAGEFVYPKLMAWEGALGVVPPECDGCVVSTEFPVFEVNEDRVLNEVLDIYFRTPSVWPEIAGESTGTNIRRRRLNPQDFLDYEMPLPSRETQMTLRKVKAEVDTLKRLQAGTAAELDALLPAILDRAFKGEL
jgi:type I restriction enzyme S subunit